NGLPLWNAATARSVPPTRKGSRCMTRYLGRVAAQRPLPRLFRGRRRTIHRVDIQTPVPDQLPELLSLGDQRVGLRVTMFTTVRRLPVLRALLGCIIAM